MRYKILQRIKKYAHIHKTTYMPRKKIRDNNKMQKNCDACHVSQYNQGIYDIFVNL